ncbi:MAG: hypothetical protein ACLVL7_09435 [Anaerotruncus massiliensis (ex Togo et al. 2019)]
MEKFGIRRRLHGRIGGYRDRVLWRGFTHWTMALTGGVGFCCST